MKIFGILDNINEINEKYKTPHLKMSPKEKFALISLRVYVFLMIAVMVYKFILVTIFKQQ